MLQGVDLLADFFCSALRLNRKRLHFGCDDSEASSGLARASRLDGRVQRKQRGLARNARNEIDDIADRSGGLAQAIDIFAGLARRGAGVVGEPGCVAHLRADALGGVGEFVGSERETFGGGLGFAGTAGEIFGADANGRECGGGRLRSGGDGRRRTLQLADHGTKFELQQVENGFG